MERKRLGAIERHNSAECGASRSHMGRRTERAQGVMIGLLTRILKTLRAKEGEEGNEFIGMFRAQQAVQNAGRITQVAVNQRSAQVMEAALNRIPKTGKNLQILTKINKD